MTNIGKRIGSILLTVMLVVTLAGCGTRDAGLEQARFEEFVKEEFRSEMESGSYSIMHQILENPENYGIDIEKVAVEFIDTEKDVETSWQEAKANTAETWKMLRDFDRNLLTPEQQEIYDSFECQLRQADAGNQHKFMYMENLWETNSGFYSQIPMVFSHMRILNEQDLQKALQLMDTLPETLDWVMTYTREQEKRGLMRIYFEEVREYCRKQVDTGMKNSVYTYLQDQINKLGLNRDLTQKYQTQLTETFQKSYLDTYKKMIENLAALQKDGDNHIGGLAQLENGRAYYAEVVLPGETGNGRTPEETIELLDRWMDESIHDIMWMAMKSPELLESFTDIQTNYTSYQEILTHLQQACQKDFPKINPVSYEMQELPEEQRQESILAYYMLNALDASIADQIRVNPTSAKNTGETYTTIAHEGVPGHMYQYNYMKENCNLWNALQFTSYSGYTEGYSRYVELVSLDYLEDVPAEQRELYRLLLIMNHVLSARMDIGIHYEGWTEDDARDYLKTCGLNPEAASEAYEALLEIEPGVITSYGVGLAEFLELREFAEDKLGDDFTQLGFHEAILKSGAAPFSVVRENVEDYVEQVKIDSSTTSY